MNRCAGVSIRECVATWHASAHVHTHTYLNLYARTHVSTQISNSGADKVVEMLCLLLNHNEPVTRGFVLNLLGKLRL